MAGKDQNLPDLLGTITNDQRVNIDVIQCAVGLRPNHVQPGQPFDIVLLVQNAADVDIDLTVKVRLPDRDANRQKTPFSLKKDRLVVGLRPAEVGFVTIPAAANPKIALGEDYQLSVDFSVKRVGKQKPNRNRDKMGGGAFNPNDLDDEVKGKYRTLTKIRFSGERSGRSGVKATFAVRDSGPQVRVGNSPNWHTLWTMRDFIDIAALIERVKEPLDAMWSNFHREVVFFPILDAVQTRFREVGGYPLRAGEAVFAAKAMTLVLEQGVSDVETGVTDQYPNWYTHMCRIFFDEPQAASDPARLFSEVLFDDVLYDAVIRSMRMIGTVTNQNYDPGVLNAKAQAVGEALAHGQLDLLTIYDPLVLGGLIANTRVVLKGEQQRDTIWMLQQALYKREAEESGENAGIFRLAEELVTRSLGQTG